MRLFFYALLFLPFLSVAQTLQGVVTDAESQKPLFPVTVVNTRTQQVSYTGPNGLFTIPANPGDKIAFSYIGYKSVEKLKPMSVIVATLNISMERQEYELPAVYFRPGLLTQYQLDSINRQETYRIQLDRRPPSVMSPVSAIAEMFSKKAKRTYQFQKDFATGEMDKFIDSRYTAEIVTGVTGLHGDSLGDFMNANRMPLDFARVATNLEMKMWIRDNYKNWIKTYIDTNKHTK